MNAENIGTTKKGIYIIENNSTKFAENVPEFCGGETIGVYAGGVLRIGRVMSLMSL